MEGEERRGEERRGEGRGVEGDGGRKGRINSTDFIISPSSHSIMPTVSAALPWTHGRQDAAYLLCQQVEDHGDISSWTQSPGLKTNVSLTI